MQINEKITDLKRNLPYGSIAQISKETGLRFNTVSDFFKMKYKPSKRVIELIIPVANRIVNEVYLTYNK